MSAERPKTFQSRNLGYPGVFLLAAQSSKSLWRALDRPIQQDLSAQAQGHQRAPGTDSTHQT